MKRFAFFFLLIALLACKHPKYIMTGYFNEQEFKQQCKWQTMVDTLYKPDTEALQKLSAMNDSFSVRLYLGSWCSDSRKQVSRFFFIENKLPVSHVEIIAVDTSKKDVKGMTQADNIKKVPTFIIYKSNKEVGRIVEKPKGRKVERHLLKIVSGN